MNIDWSKAPKGATHKFSDPTTNPWRDLSGETWKYWSEGEWIDSELRTDTFMKRQAHRLTVVEPIGWTGEGLPPVGAVCEVVSPGYSNDRFDRFIGQTVTVIAHDVIDADPVAVFRMPVDGQIDEQDYHALVKQCFRPIRTPEQIAAEERTKTIDDMVKALGIDSPGTADYIRCGLIYDAGYRKQVAP